MYNFVFILLSKSGQRPVNKFEGLPPFTRTTTNLRNNCAYNLEKFVNKIYSNRWVIIIFENLENMFWIYDRFTMENCIYCYKCWIKLLLKSINKFIIQRARDCQNLNRIIKKKTNYRYLKYSRFFFFQRMKNFGWNMCRLN